MKVIIKINLLFTLMLIANYKPNSLFAQSGWSTLNLPSVTNSRGIYFKNANTGIVSDFKTTNGGQSWVNINPSSEINALSFPDTAIGYCIASTSGGQNIYKTTNLGNNWVIQQSPSALGLTGLYFININTGYACGGAHSIIKTTNGGNNWILLNDNFPFYYYTNIYFVNTLTGFITGYTDTGYVIKTTDGGQNWNIKYFTGQQFHSIFFINSNTGFIGGTNLFVTTNSGVNWNQKFGYNSPPMFSIYFPSPSTGYACYANGDIIKTIDGGNLWLRQYPVTSYALYSIFFINNDVGYACANDHGIVLKTTNGGGPPIGIKSIDTEIPDRFSLSQNYPNPFNPVTIINYELPTAGLVKMVIYDILGREVKTLVNEKQSAGKYKVDFDGTNLPSGVYFYRLESGDFVSTKKMVLLK
jgi:photosystem II stability/assembly factor-like uncharacterized protein